jgi:ribosomal protein L11 methyltransferase
VVVPCKLAGPLQQALVRAGAVGTQEAAPPGVEVHYKQPWEKGPAPKKPAKALIRAWFTTRPSAAVLQALPLEAAEWEEQRDADWEEDWKKNFDTLVISDNLVITPPWKPIPGALIIEPGNAFGTGEHVTTRSCLQAISQLAIPGENLLDVGCGSGILALAGAKLGMKVVGIDIEPDSVRSAQEAARLNQLEADFSMTPLNKVQGQFSLVVANLFAEVLVELATDLLRVSSGQLIFAGILADRARLVRERFSCRPCLSDIEEEGWVSLVYGR